MSLFTRFVRINIAMLIFVSAAFADVPVELRNLVLTGDMNGRSDADFTTKPTDKKYRKNKKDQKNNVTALVPKGTRGTVLEVRKLEKTHSFGIKLKVTDLSKNPSKDSRAVTKDQEVWVYYSATKANWLKFKDIDGSVVQDPEVALTAQAKRDGEALPAVPGTLKNPELPTAEEVKREEEEDAKRDAQMGEDPNDFGRSEIKGTQGGFCTTYPCTNSNSINETNISQVTNVTDALDALPKKETPSKAKEPPKKVPPTPPAKNEAMPERPISRSPKTEQVTGKGKWGKFPEITEWENGLGQKLSANTTRKRHGFGGFCYKRVKRDLQRSDIVKDYLPGGHARDGVRDLLNQNKKAKKDSEYEWVNLLDDARYSGMIKSPYDVPHGAIVVSWTKESFESGDIQVRNARGKDAGFASDGYSPRPIQEQPKGRYKAKKGKPYIMQGVMVKIKKQR